MLEQEYQNALKQMLEKLTKDKSIRESSAVIFLGGQPAAGKSTFRLFDNDFDNYITIDGDKYRKYYPGYETLPTELMPEITQSFVNRMVEDLIDVLSRDGYNLIIEGTLRDASIPIGTATLLKERNYRTELYVLSCNATESWNDTVNRANTMRKLGYVVRTVPLEKYNEIVNVLPHNLNLIYESKVMDTMVLIDRRYNILWDSRKKELLNPGDRLAQILDLNAWNKKYSEELNPGQSVNFVRRGRGR